MATNERGLPKLTRRAMARKAALAFAGIALAACSSMPTEPQTNLDRWDGKPVVTTSKNCGSGGCASVSALTN